MPAPLHGSIGILPAGALGVSFFYQLTRQLEQVDGTVFFIERSGSGSAAALRAKGELRIADARTVHGIVVGNVLKPDLLGCYRAGCLPEVLLVCPNPDQILGVISECVPL